MENLLVTTFVVTAVFRLPDTSGSQPATESILEAWSITPKDMAPNLGRGVAACITARVFLPPS